jgi:hypothetical protein
MEGTERLVNCRNGAVASRPLPDSAVRAREARELQQELQQAHEALRRAALARLLQRSREDPALADLLLVLGLA